MKVRAAVTVDLSPEDIKAFCRYNNMSEKDRPQILRQAIVSTICQVGTMGLEEQLFQGQQSLDSEHGG